MDNKELIKNAAEQSGFNLEFRAKSILETNGFNTSINKILKYKNTYLEIDLVGNHEEQHLVIECKGTSNSDFLVLVKEAKNNILPSAPYKISNSEWDLANFFNKKEPQFFTFTGDFFKANNQGLKQLSKNDLRNNLYKAQSQILDAIQALSETKFPPRDLTNIIIPLIVTNANIWVVDYNESEVEVDQYKWVLHRVKTSNQGIVEKHNDKEVLTMPIPIVNINHLNLFLESIKDRLVNGSIQIENSFLDSL